MGGQASASASSLSEVISITLMDLLNSSAELRLTIGDLGGVKCCIMPEEEEASTSLTF